MQSKTKCLVKSLCLLTGLGLSVSALAVDGISKAEFDWLMSDVVIPAPTKLAATPQPVRSSSQVQKQPATSAKVAAQLAARKAPPPVVQTRTDSANSLPASVLGELQKAKVNASTMSAFVLRVGDKHPMLVYNENQPRVPASVMKLITTYTALGVLGPNYRWPTEVYMSGQLRSGTLTGNLIIKGYGAPDLTETDLRKILRQLKAKGIRNFSGNLIVDNSYFQTPNIDPGAFDGKPMETYNAQPEAFLLNERTSEFVVQNSAGRATVYSPARASNVRIVNNIRSVNSRCRGRARYPSMSVKPEAGGHVVTFGGTFSTRCTNRTYKRAISDSAHMLHGAMAQYWKHDVGGNFNARLINGRVPGNARLLYTHKSAPLREIIKEVNKESNNLMARQLMLTIGARRLGAPSTPRKSELAIKQWLQSVGLNFPELRIENGSGLSRWSRVSARHVGELLLHAYRSPHRSLMMGSLAVAGMDGTMKTRLRKTPIAGRGRFKTGTLKDTRAIAGYVKGYDGRDYIVSILHNDQTARRRGKKAHDALIQWAYWRGRLPQKLAKN